MTVVADMSYHLPWLPRGKAGAKVNHPALWKNRHQVFVSKSGDKRLYKRPRNKKKWAWVSPNNIQRAAPACYEMSHITAMSPHQRAENRKKLSEVTQVDDTLCFPKVQHCSCRHTAQLQTALMTTTQLQPSTEYPSWLTDISVHLCFEKRKQLP